MFMTTYRSGALTLLVAALALANAASSTAQDVRALAVNAPLGTAGSYAALASSTLTNTGGSVLTGDAGVFPGAAIVGFPPGGITGVFQAGTAAAGTAQNDVTTAYNMLAGQACDVNMTGIDLGGKTLTPGVYCFNTSAQLTGALTLDALGNPGAVWVFQTGSTITTAAGSAVTFINGGQACGAFWQIGSSATIGIASAFKGNIFALASITMTTGASNAGGLFARTGAVTLDNNAVAVVGSCGFGPPPPPPIPPGPPIPPVPALPDLAAAGLLAALLVSGILLARR
jgi:type VI secretion system secreted protein VgrG